MRFTLLPLACARRGCGARPQRRHTARSRALVVCLLGVVGAATAQTSSSVLTFDGALEAARTRSAMLQAQDAAMLAARELAVSAGRLPDPVLRLSLDNLPVEGPMRYSLTDDFMTMRSVGLTQTFVGSAKRQARAARYEREADAASAVRSMQTAKLSAQTARAWFERYFQEQMVALIEQQRNEAGRVKEAVEAAYRGGRSTQADVLAAQAAIARIDDRLHEVRADLATARALLQRWTGDSDVRPLGTPPDTVRTRVAEHALDHEIDQHPDIAVMNAREQMALAEADVARQDRNADWTWSLMYSNRGDQFGDMVSFGVSVPLQWDQARKQDRDLSARLQKAEQLRLEREEVRREHVFEVRRLLAGWRSSLARLEDYDNTLVPLAVERVAAMEAAFRGGRAPLSAVLDAQRMVTDVRLERLRIERQAAAAWAELEFLIPREQLTQAASLRPSNPSTPEFPR